MMAVKSKSTENSKKAAVKKMSVKTQTAAKKTPRAAHAKAQSQPAPVAASRPKPASIPIQGVKRKVVTNPLVERRRASASKQAARSAQFNFMKAPGLEHDFQVGDTVEVFCDHEKNRDRIRGWVKGIVVQVDHKLAAVQFRSNVFLTDGWMVPDRILWFPVNSEHIRPLGSGKKTSDKKDMILDY
ncbi:MAG: hypothetical protein Fur002_04420 [Anaerolineales bacterium]